MHGNAAPAGDEPDDVIARYGIAAFAEADHDVLDAVDLDGAG